MFGLSLTGAFSACDSITKVAELDDRAMAQQPLIENLQRENLPEIDKAEGIRRLVEMEITTPSSQSSRNEAIEHVRVLLGYASNSTIEQFLS